MCVAGADAVSMAVLAAAALAWDGTENAKRADAAVMIIQLLVLAGRRHVLSYGSHVFV